MTTSRTKAVRSRSLLLVAARVGMRAWCLGFVRRLERRMVPRTFPAGSRVTANMQQMQKKKKKKKSKERAGNEQGRLPGLETWWWWWWGDDDDGGGAS